MQIQYFGLSSFKLTGKDTSSIIDPFSKESGLTPPRGSADLVILSEKDSPLFSYTQSISGQPFMVDGPGEYDVKGHTITGVPVKDGDRVITIYLIEIEGVKILNLAHLKKLALTEDQLDDIGEVDIMIVPIGGKDVMDFDEASKAVNRMEPKIVIPSCYKISGLALEFAPEDKFIKEMGGKVEKIDKLSIKKKDLEEEGTKLVILEPLRS
ncbi:MBL fold metallo-hydrolase [Patescibacteria group bacterium]|nr:MBL fold metallo-hydrolase [Patescibacteria group bacterium]